MDNNPAFNDAYWLHQPAEVRALRVNMDTRLPGEADREKLGQELARRGFVIDLEIQVWNGDPWKMMLMRRRYGYVWVPSLTGTKVMTAPGEANPGTVPYYPDRPEPDSIKVSTDLADYPPFDPPAIPGAVVAKPSSYVGSYQGGGVYAALTGDPARDGGIVGETRGKFLKHYIAGPFGVAQWYTVAV